MTVKEINERDPKGEMQGWLKEMATLVERPLATGE